MAVTRRVAQTAAPSKTRRHRDRFGALATAHGWCVTSEQAARIAAHQRALRVACGHLLGRDADGASGAIARLRLDAAVEIAYHAHRGQVGARSFAFALV
jgi:hypothetical protein